MAYCLARVFSGASRQCFLILMTVLKRCCRAPWRSTLLLQGSRNTEYCKETFEERTNCNHKTKITICTYNEAVPNERNSCSTCGGPHDGWVMATDFPRVNLSVRLGVMILNRARFCKLCSEKCSMTEMSHFPHRFFFFRSCSNELCKYLQGKWSFTHKKVLASHPAVIRVL